MKLLTNLDECKDLSRKEDNMTKLFKEQSEDADLREEGREGDYLSEREKKLSTKQCEEADLMNKEGEEERIASWEQEVVRCTDLPEDEGEKGKANTEGREVVTCCSSEHKYLFGINWPKSR